MAPSAPLLSLLLLPLLLASSTDAQKLRLGPCPDIHPVTDFNITAFSGLWYENRKLPYITQVGHKCGTVRYSDDLGGSISAIYAAYFLNKPIRFYGYAVSTNGSDVASFSLGFPAPDDPTVTNYSVIEVDYDRYAVAYSCSNLLGNISHKESLWILTRQPKFPDQEAKQIVWNLMKRGIFQAYEMQRTDQYFCPGRESPIAGIEFSTSVEP